MSEKKDKDFKAVLIVAAVLIGLTLFLILGIRYSNDNSKYTYNYFPFEKEGILWVTTTEKTGQPYKIPFYHHPTELLDIIVEPDIEQYLLRKAVSNPNTTLVITLDPDMGSRPVVAAVEISRLTGSRYDILNLKTYSALTRPPEDATADTQTPIVTCDDANEENVVIWLTIGDSSVISRQGDCIVLEAVDPKDTIRVADRFAYMLLGIMD